MLRLRINSECATILFCISKNIGEDNNLTNNQENSLEYAYSRRSRMLFDAHEMASAALKPHCPGFSIGPMDSSASGALTGVYALKLQVCRALE